MIDEESKQILKDEYGIEGYGNAVYEISRLPDPPFSPDEPKPKPYVSPYAKFDKYHRKKRKQ